MVHHGQAERIHRLISRPGQQSPIVDERGVNRVDEMSSAPITAR